MEKPIEEIKQLARDIFEPKTAIDGIDLAFAAVSPCGKRCGDSGLMGVSRMTNEEKQIEEMAKSLAENLAWDEDEIQP